MTHLPLLLAVQGAETVAAPSAFGRMEMLFLGLWLLFSLLYWTNYRKSESLPGSFAKVLGLLGFVYLVLKGFGWLAAPVPPEQAILMPWQDVRTAIGPRVPFFAYAFEVFAVCVIALIVWYARRKFGTVLGVVLSAWDRGHWYMLPVLFILMTVGLLLVAAAASPVLSPFIYTLF
ncbi:MAG: hypothetical protein H6825_16380 [Planctomycetes bacterium]|nr:hypothetical protein [Planctomycetota bacterium]